MALEETNEDRLRNEIAQLESDGERMSARIAALEAQLAAEASAVETSQRLAARLEISEGVERSLRKQLGDRGPWEQLLDQFRDKGQRVTVAVEVYDTKGTSKRGHAATFAEAVAQVKAMLEND